MICGQLHHPRFGEERKKGDGRSRRPKQRIPAAERWLARLCGEWLSSRATHHPSMSLT